jgi:DNA-binding response OmpR family regulator
VAEHAALLVIDIHLPGISGLELHRQLAQRYDLGPTIFITARDDAKLRLQAHQVGQYLVKPFRGQSLLQMVEATLRQSG